MDDFVPPNLHEDAGLFRESVNFTAARTGFNPRLVEKDYFGTVLLAYLLGRGGSHGRSLVQGRKNGVSSL